MFSREATNSLSFAKVLNKHQLFEISHIWSKKKISYWLKIRFTIHWYCLELVQWEAEFVSVLLFNPINLLLWRRGLIEKRGREGRNRSGVWRNMGASCIHLLQKIQGSHCSADPVADEEHWVRIPSGPWGSISFLRPLSVCCLSLVMCQLDSSAGFEQLLSD